MERTITVKGVGTLNVRPNYICLSLNIHSRKPSYTEAMEHANHRISLLQTATQKCGFDKKDIKTVSFHVDTEYESVRDSKGNYQRKFIGFCCRYDLKLGFDFNSDILALVLTEISECGAEPELSIQFTVKNPSAVQEALLESAAQNAQEKARILCKASGAKLGQLMSIDYNWMEHTLLSVSRYEATDSAMPMLAKRAAAPEFEPEDIEVSDTVAFLWAIE